MPQMSMMSKCDSNINITIETYKHRHRSIDITMETYKHHHGNINITMETYKHRDRDI